MITPVLSLLFLLGVLTPSLLARPAAQVQIFGTPDCANPPHTDALQGIGGTLRYELKDDVLFALALAYGNRAQAVATGCSFDGWSNQEVYDLINKGVELYHDTSPVSPDTPPQQVEEFLANDFAPAVRQAIPAPDLPKLDTIPRARIREFRAGKNIIDIHDAIEAAARWRFSVAYKCDKAKIDAAMTVFSAVGPLDIIFFINDAKTADRAEEKKLSLGSPVNDLFTSVTVGDIDFLCHAIDERVWEWQQIPWPKIDTYESHKDEIYSFTCPRSQGDQQQVPGKYQVAASLDQTS